MIWLSSDLHFCHNRGFLYEPRGFKSVDEMNEAIVERFNAAGIQSDDEVYLLGDLMLNNNEKGLEYLRRLPKAHYHIVIGNHDTATRQALYRQLDGVEEVSLAAYFKYNGYHFYCSHYPTLTGNLEKESLKQMTLNLFGHTHSKDKFYEDRPYMYNVAVDAHNCSPVNIETIISDMKTKVKECLDQL